MVAISRESQRCTENDNLITAIHFVDQLSGILLTVLAILSIFLIIDVRRRVPAQANKQKRRLQKRDPTPSLECELCTEVKLRLVQPNQTFDISYIYISYLMFELLRAFMFIVRQSAFRGSYFVRLTSSIMGIRTAIQIVGFQRKL